MNCYSLSQNTGPRRPRTATVITVIFLLSLNALVSAAHVVAAATASHQAIINAMVDAKFGDYVPPEKATHYTVTVAVHCWIQAAFWLWMAIEAYWGRDRARILSFAVGVPLALFGFVFDTVEGVSGLSLTAISVASLGLAVLTTAMMWSCGYRHSATPPHSSLAEWSS